MSLRIPALLIGALACAAPAVHAQRAESRVSVSAGSATDVTGVRSNAATVGASAILSPVPRLAFNLGASGTRFDAGQWSASVGGNMSGRSSTGRAALTLDGGADFTTTSYQVSYFVATVLPAAQVSVGPLVFFGGARASQARTMVPALVDGPLPPLGHAGTGARESIARSGATLLAGSLVEWVAPHVGRLAIRYSEEAGTVAEASQHDRQLTIGMSHGALSLSGYGAMRDAVGDRVSFGGGAMSVALNPRVMLEVAGGRYPSNRLTGAAAGRFVSAGLSFRFAASPPALPRPDAVRPAARGMTRLSIAAPNAEWVEVAGDFSNWTVLPAHRASNGVWYVDLALKPGEYRYAFRVNGREWRVPTGARTAEDDFGGRTAWVTVQETGAGRVVKQ